MNSALPPGFPSRPAFGQADLSNCEREQIHLAGAIQPHGALLVVREADEQVVQASRNAAEFLGLDASPVGRLLAALGGDLAARLRPHLTDPLDQIPTAVRCHAGQPGRPVDALVHRPRDGGLVVELEPAGPALGVAAQLEGALQAILGTYTLQALCDEAARIFHRVTGYDRIMVYRFDEDGHGQVFAEQKTPGLEAYLGNRYPATDIPQIARRLYEKNRIRQLVDVNFTPVPVEPVESPFTGAPLDMSLCVLRASSPIHVQYLKNMGVAATLVCSVMAGGRLWGLVACHHETTRFVPFEVRAACELLSEALGTRIAALESFVQAQADMSVRRLEQRMIEGISREGDWRGALFDNPQPLLQVVGATGAALLFEGQLLTAGEVPDTAALRAIGAWLQARPAAAVHATNCLGFDVPALERCTAMAAGVLATPVSSSPGEFLMWFRPEQVRTLTWGGDPTKPMQVAETSDQLSPRASFAQWHQVVEGTAEPWSLRDLTTARLIGDTVSDVVLQFRSVRMLIAADQLAQVRRQVTVSDQPLLIADADGVVTLANQAFEQMMPGWMAATGQPRHVAELLERVADSQSARHRMDDLLEGHRSWRGELHLIEPDGTERPVLLRADAVFNAPTRVLGFVFLFTDLTERKAAQAARLQFQEDIVSGHRVKPGRLDSQADLAFRRLFSTVLENAKLAALEITDGTEVARMPALLDSVRASTSRTALVLEQLISHGQRDADPGP